MLQARMREMQRKRDFTDLVYKLCSPLCLSVCCHSLHLRSCHRYQVYCHRSSMDAGPPYRQTTPVCNLWRTSLESGCDSYHKPHISLWRTHHPRSIHNSRIPDLEQRGDKFWSGPNCHSRDIFIRGARGHCPPP